MPQSFAQFRPAPSDITRPSGLRRALPVRPRALSAAALALALTAPLASAAPSSAAPVDTPSAPITVPAENVQSATQYTRTAVNVRSGPSTDHSIVGSYAEGTEVSGSWTDNGWLHLGDGRYISGSVLVDGGSSETVTKHTRTAVNVRSGASTDHSIVGSYAEGTELTGRMTSTGWLSLGGGRYVSDVVLTDGGGGAISGADVLAEGRKYFGIMYRGGGASPSTGFDCSGYTQYVFGQLGIDLPRTTGDQRSVAVPVSDPQPGDLVFWGSPAYHVAIYAGDGYIYDSGKPGLPVQKRPMFSGVSGFGRVL